MLKPIFAVSLSLYMITKIPVQQRLDFKLPTSLQPFEQYIINASIEHKVPAIYIASVIYNESKGNPKALGEAGEQGLAQLLPRFHAKGKNLWDPETNIDACASYLREGYLVTNSITETLRYYNGGPEYYRKSVTLKYMEKVLAIKKKILDGTINLM